MIGDKTACTGAKILIQRSVQNCNNCVLFKLPTDIKVRPVNK